MSKGDSRVMNYINRCQPTNSNTRMKGCLLGIKTESRGVCVRVASSRITLLGFQWHGNNTACTKCVHSHIHAHVCQNECVKAKESEP